MLRAGRWLTSNNTWPRFDDIAKLLANAVVKPRLDALIELFSGARTRADEQAHRYSTWFAYSDRYPVTAKLEFAIEHDQSVEQVFVRYEANLMPVFFHYQPHDRLTIPLDQFDPERTTEWVERRVFEFLEIYLRHDRGAENLDEDIVADPVCGMRLSRSDAKESADYRGHGYFFCSAECRVKFEGEPEHFVTFRTM